MALQPCRVVTLNFWCGSYTSLQPSWLVLIPSVYYLRCAIAVSSFYFTLHQQHLVPVGVKLIDLCEASCISSLCDAWKFSNFLFCKSDVQNLVSESSMHSHHGVSSLWISCSHDAKASVSKDLVLLAACSNSSLAAAGSTNWSFLRFDDCKLWSLVLWWHSNWKLGTRMIVLCGTLWHFVALCRHQIDDPAEWLCQDSDLPSPKKDIWVVSTAVMPWLYHYPTFWPSKDWPSIQNTTGPCESLPDSPSDPSGEPILGRSGRAGDGRGSEVISTHKILSVIIYILYILMILFVYVYNI